MFVELLISSIFSMGVLAAITAMIGVVLGIAAYIESDDRDR